MALSGIQRTFADILDSIWGKDAQTSIPTQPVSGIAYRDTDAEFESGQKYDSLGESSRWNQMLYLLTGLMSELTAFGILPWSAAQPYSKGALCIGSDGTLWQAQIDIAASPTNPVPPGTDDNVWSRPKIFGFVPDSIRVIAGTGMTGGGPLSGDVTLSAKLDGKTTQADAGGVITVKDVAIEGDSSDLASARGQIGNYRARFAAGEDLNNAIQAGVYAVSPGCANVPMSGTSDYYVLEVIRDNSNVNAVTQFIHSRVNTAGPTWSRRRISDGTWQPWQQLVQTNYIGDGIRVSRSKALADGTGGLCIISVPEYEGATASTAGTSGLVPPATAGQQESFLTGGGEYKPALSTGGGTVTGSLSIKNMLDLINAAPATEQELGLFMLDKNGTIMGAHDFVHNVENIKAAQMYARNSSGLISSLGVYVEEDGTRYTLSSHNIILTSDVEIGRMYADGVRLITFSGTKSSPGLMMRYSPDSGELYLDGRAMHGKADTAGYADTAGSANALGGKAESALSVAYARDSGAMNGKAESALSVNYANSAGQVYLAGSAVQWVVNLSGPQITVPLGGTYNVVCICFNDSGGKGAVKHYPNTAGGTVIPNAPTDYMVAGLCARVA